MLKPFKLLSTTLMLCSLASFNLTAEAAEKLLIPLGKSVSIPAYGVKKILAVKDNVVDVLNVSDDEIILSGIGDEANATQLILWDMTGKRVYDVETYSELNIIHEKFDAIINNKNLTLKVFPDAAYLQGQASSKEEKKRAETVAKSLVGNKQLISLVEYEAAVSSLQQRIEAAIKQPDVKVSVVSARIDPNDIAVSQNPLVATDSTGIRVILQGSVKNQNDYINMSEIVKGFVTDEKQISNLVTITDPYQVLFQAYILQVTKKNSEDLGIKWSGTDAGYGTLNFMEIGDGTGNAVLPKHMNPFYMKNVNRLSLVEAQVKAWEESGKAKVISKPNLLVYASAIPQPSYFSRAESSWHGEANPTDPSNDQGLAFVDVGQTVQVEKDAGNGKTSYEPFEAKLRLCVRDLYIDDDELKFSVYAQQEELSFERGNGASPDKHSRDIMTTVRIKDQQTIALGGLISKNNSISWYGVPGLSRLPLVGRLFKHRSVSNSENELIILLTPKIINKEKDLLGNKKFETIKVPRRSDKLENLNNIFEQIKSSHVPADK
jgi:Flp pilus assembly secretin CpaC